MKNKILSILIISFGLSLCGMMSGCNEKSNASLIDPEEVELTLYESNTVVNGEFYINSNNDITLSLPIFSNPEYDVAQKYYNGYILIEIVDVVGTNIDKVNCQLADSTKGGVSPLSNEVYFLNPIGFNISTNNDGEDVVAISSITLSIDEELYEITTDISVFIVPNADFIQAEGGTLLFYSLGKDYSNAILKGYFDSKFLETFYLNSRENYFTDENDSIEFDEFKFSHKGNIAITDISYGFNSNDHLKVSNGEMGDSIKSAFNIIFKSNINGNGKDINYFSLVVKYHFSYDPTIRTVVLGCYINSNSNQIIENMVNDL